MNLRKLPITVARVEGATGFPTEWFITCTIFALVALACGYFAVSFVRKKRFGAAAVLLLSAIGGVYAFYSFWTRVG